MRFVPLVYENEESVKAFAPADMEARIKAYGDFVVGIHESGQMKAGEGLQPTATATTIRVRDGETRTSAGPFAKSKEQLSGFYVVEAENLDEATAIAARIPSAGYGSIEIRPVMPIPETSPAWSAPGLLSDEVHRPG